mmetsp:Transcript_7129/g.10620  ORF Transcript_7129/g.10620 Transcript_7129/m.10620 type:complete len:270 (-) Transcript_7129:246-1055(-)
MNDDTTTKTEESKDQDHNDTSKETDNTSSEPSRKKYRLRPPSSKSLIDTESKEQDQNDHSECPKELIWSRDYLFNGIDKNIRMGIRMDTVASFSVTESRMADRMTETIMRYVPYGKDTIIFDGMSCVGGNTISFAKYFNRVLSNEFDKSRYDMLIHNVRDVIGLDNVVYFNDSILTLALTQSYDVLFLDPEWGGPDYKHKKNLRLHIGDEPVEDFCSRVLQGTSVSMIALKLPVNYDNDYMRQFAEENDCKYSFFSNFRKMTLTILRRK